MRPYRITRVLPTTRFQSTHPLRGATKGNGWSSRQQEFQSTHPLRGATIYGITGLMRKEFQSTHPLRGATLVPRQVSILVLFQSTHPLRGATCRPGRRRTLNSVSIHAPLARCDLRLRGKGHRLLCFNPRTPCEVRLPMAVMPPSFRCFNPRTPCEVRRYWIANGR